MPCKACGLNHSPMVRCEVAKRLVVHAETVVVHAPVGSSRHGKYLDEEKRRSYRKEWAKLHRALKSGRAVRI